ncbi:hypothetical protein CYMTET_10580 [Cymbomonas tetramitiformis]|uniref:Threonine/serine exporter-like N-terminal domain-containing protein n=1 Tax=Cymbomonas tetramitiformis TaxID=36881 RepID=A0AAE0GNW8_9CHLO|nr:hypothetical protein CYMTET_10580 [Cymbomonas tetramitiformis]|eukprot:gene23121-27974_t
MAEVETDHSSPLLPPDLENQQNDLEDECEEPYVPWWRDLRAALGIDWRVSSGFMDAIVDQGTLQCEEGRKKMTRIYRDTKSIGPYEPLTEGDIRKLYTGSGVVALSERQLDGIIVVLKLALSLSAAGMSTAEIECLTTGVAESLNLPKRKIQVTMRHVQASFGYIQHFLSTTHSKVLHKLGDLHTIASAVQLADQPDLMKTLALIEIVNARPSPFGWAVENLGYHGFGAFATIAIFRGNWYDFTGVVIVSVAVRLTMFICSFHRALNYLSDIIVPIVIGALTPVVTKYVLCVDNCHNGTIFTAILLIDLPGSELLFAARELKKGNIVGAPRMINAIVTIMYMAMSITLGWQISAYFINNIHHSKPWVVDIDSCAPMTGWWMANAVMMVPLELCFFTVLGIRIRNMFAPGLAVIATMCMNAVWQRHFPDEESYIANAIVTFVGTNLGCGFEYMTGGSHVQILLPIIVILAPGAGALVKVMHQINGDGTNDAWFDLLMQGVSFALGQTLAAELWGPALHTKAAVRVDKTAKDLSSKQTVQKVSSIWLRKARFGYISSA